MPIPMKATAIRENHAWFLHHTAQGRRELRRIASDPNLTERGKRERTTAIVDELEPIRERSLAASRKLLDEARADLMARLPATIQLNAALETPDRARQVRELAAEMSPVDLLHLATSITEQQDMAAAFGLRQAMAAARAQAIATSDAQGDVLDDSWAEIVTLLDQIGGSEYERALAQFVAAQHTFLQLELANPRNDPFANPARLLNAARGARAVPTDASGATRILSESEFVRLLGRAGLDPAVPADPADQADQADTMSSLMGADMLSSLMAARTVR